MALKKILSVLTISSLVSIYKTYGRGDMLDSFFNDHGDQLLPY